MKLISSDNIQNIQIKTTEQISKKYIKTFIKTQLALHNVKLYENSKILYYFIKEAFIYEIFVINSNQTILIPYLFYQLDLKEITIVVYNNYFCVFKDKKLYFFKIGNFNNINEIKRYIKVVYKIDINNVIKIDNLDKFNSNMPKIKYINFSNKNYSIFVFLFLFISLIFLFLYPQKIENKIVYEHFTHKKYYPKFKKLFQFAKIAKVQIISLKANKTKIEFKILVNNKKDFYHLLKIINFKVKLYYIRQVEDKIEISGYFR